MEVYWYAPAADARNIAECGLKLSRWADREVMLKGEKQKCITALLNPRDDMDKYRDGNLQCLRLDVEPRYCYVADRYLYDAGRSHPAAMRLYEQSMIPAETYVFGSYRLPECLVTSTILPERISMVSKWLDTPILFDNSENLYINNIIEINREHHEDFDDALLYSFYSKLAASGRMNLFEDRQKGVAVFSDNRTGKVVSVRIPDFNAY